MRPGPGGGCGRHRAPRDRAVLAALRTAADATTRADARRRCARDASRCPSLWPGSCRSLATSPILASGRRAHRARRAASLRRRAPRAVRRVGAAAPTRWRPAGRHQVVPWSRHDLPHIRSRTSRAHLARVHARAGMPRAFCRSILRYILLPRPRQQDGSVTCGIHRAPDARGRAHRRTHDARADARIPRH